MRGLQTCGIIGGREVSLNLCLRDMVQYPVHQSVSVSLSPYTATIRHRPAVMTSVASERNQHCRGKVRPKGPKKYNLKPEGISQGPQVLGEGLTAPPHQLGTLRECCENPQLDPQQGPSCQEFWCILGSSG